jgi:cyclopropane fatty-acyl-phospholipid synthase-like methyltransferase
VRGLQQPKRHRILDIGAGAGRNTLALARAGFAVDALELAPGFCQGLRRAARAERLPIEVIQSSLFAPELRLGRARYSVVVCSEVTSHFRGFDELRRFFELGAACTRRGGSLLTNVFLAEPGFEPTPAARELSQISWSTLFTRAQLAKATRGLGFLRVSDESVHDYERANQPADSWPPTSWFASWSRGFNCYRVSRGPAPMELRWLHYRKRAAERGRG